MKFTPWRQAENGIWRRIESIERGEVKVPHVRPTMTKRQPKVKIAKN